MDAKPSGRFLTGHSSGGWFALWTIVRYPALFGASWPTSPDPVDFRAFLGVDLYAPGANMYHDATGAPRPLERDGDKVLTTIEQAAKLEAVLGHNGGQLRSFDWTFSPRGADGTPAFMFDRETGAVNPEVAAYWRDNYDIGHLIETDWPTLKTPSRRQDPSDRRRHRLLLSRRRSCTASKAPFARSAGRADFTFVPHANHGMAQVYAKGDDRAALWKDMARAIYAIARPSRQRRATR